MCVCVMSIYTSLNLVHSLLSCYQLMVTAVVLQRKEVEKISLSEVDDAFFGSFFLKSIVSNEASMDFLVMLTN